MSFGSLFKSLFGIVKKEEGQSHHGLDSTHDEGPPGFPGGLEFLHEPPSMTHTTFTPKSATHAVSAGQLVPSLPYSMPSVQNGSIGVSLLADSRYPTTVSTSPKHERGSTSNVVQSVKPFSYSLDTNKPQTKYSITVEGGESSIFNLSLDVKKHAEGTGTIGVYAVAG
ncbi:hypothetical protein RhiJN_25767 [Ceratobasidium sp. AG-Ba]|nr:hypothetical protein RhiJN_25767 [Ceratobasidium sp. AG-Ba]